MSHSTDLFAIAAHLHVLLRRKTGRVTDTEWLARNADYAREIVRFAREKAATDGHDDLLPWADKLEAAVGRMAAVPRKTLLEVAAETLRAGQVAPAAAPSGLRTGFAHSVPASGFRESNIGASTYGEKARDPNDPANKYVGGIR